MSLRPPRLIALLALVFLALATLAAGPALAEAGQRVEFKNGHTLIVEAVEVKDDVVVVTMHDGGEIAFPRALIAEVEEGHKAPQRRGPAMTKGSPRSPQFHQLPGSQRLARQKGERVATQMRGTLDRGAFDSGQRITVGYRYRDSLRADEIYNTGSFRNTLDLSDRQARSQSAIPPAGDGAETPVSFGQTSERSGAPALTMPRVRASEPNDISDK